VFNPLERLSPREAEVLALVAEGLANKEIAVQLDPEVTEETVKGYLKSIFAKLQVHSRTEAAAVFIRWSEGRARG
jgi:DNA-binding NarL/FixJ family response regulator